MRYALLLLLAGCATDYDYYSTSNPYHGMRQSSVEFWQSLRTGKIDHDEAMDAAMLPPGRVPVYAAGQAGSQIGRGIAEELGHHPQYTAPHRRNSYTQCRRNAFGGFECWTYER